MHILNKNVIRLPKISTIGCHPSILPNYRGLEVFFWALVNGEKESGVSVFYMTEKINEYFIEGKINAGQQASNHANTLASLSEKLVPEK